MTRDNDLEKKVGYAPLDTKYLLYSNTEEKPLDNLLGHRVTSTVDKIVCLYQQLYQRGEISYKLIKETEAELLETSSEIYNQKFNASFDSNQLSSLERRLDLLQKTKNTELVDYWRDGFKIKNYLLNAIEEYREMKNKRDFLR